MQGIAIRVLVLVLLGLGSRVEATSLVYSHAHNGTGTTHLSSFWAPEGSDSDQETWDGFTLAANTSITEITWKGGHDPSLWPWSTPVSSFTISIWGSGANGFNPNFAAGPLASYESGNACAESYAGSAGGTVFYNYHYVLPAAFPAQANTVYWLQVTAWQSNVPDWGMAVGTGGNNSCIRTAANHSYQSLPGDNVFALYSADTPTATITALAQPSNGGSTFGSGSYPLGGFATVTATANAGYAFLDWTENGNEVSNDFDYTFPVTGDRTLVANFVSTRVLSIVSSPPMGGTTTGAGIHPLGAVVPITATPVPGYQFQFWQSGGVPQSTNPVFEWTINSNWTLTAVFSPFPNTSTFDFDTGSPAVGP
ncbi:MAG: hypothetical protein KC488_08415, partial [Candidatus Cloacimonetes bacterium]|nr:hypothetical protein [Candidatus Cloacimonadota bacterium]